MVKLFTFIVSLLIVFSLSFCSAPAKRRRSRSRQKSRALGAPARFPRRRGKKKARCLILVSLTDYPISCLTSERGSFIKAQLALGPIGSVKESRPSARRQSPAVDVVGRPREMWQSARKHPAYLSPEQKALRRVARPEGYWQGSRSRRGPAFNTRKSAARWQRSYKDFCTQEESASVGPKNTLVHICSNRWRKKGRYMQALANRTEQMPVSSVMRVQLMLEVNAIRRRRGGVDRLQTQGGR